MLQIALVPDRMKRRRPVPSAQAQAAYDCWVEQAQEKWVPTVQGRTCRAQFYAAFCHLYDGTCRGDAIAQETVMRLARMDHLSRVFFASGGTALDNAGRHAVSQAAAAYKNGGHEVIVAGHADRVGSWAANQKLSAARSRAVEKALIARGVPARAIILKAYGETQPRVATPDDRPSRDNRRALIVVR